MRADVFGALGADPARDTSRAKLGTDGKLNRFSFSMDQATVERMGGPEALNRSGAGTQQ